MRMILIVFGPVVVPCLIYTFIWSIRSNKARSRGLQPPEFFAGPLGVIVFTGLLIGLIALIWLSLIADPGTRLS